MSTQGITRADLLNAAAEKLLQMAGFNGADTETREATPRGKKRRRKVSKKLTNSRTFPAQQILELIRAKGPLRGPEIGDLTGLAPGAVRVKINELKQQGAVKDIREGTIIRFAAARGAGTPRKSTPKAGGRKKTRRVKKKRAAKKAAATTVASA